MVAGKLVDVPMRMPQAYLTIDAVVPAFQYRPERLNRVLMHVAAFVLPSRCAGPFRDGSSLGGYKCWHHPYTRERRTQPNPVQSRTVSPDPCIAPASPCPGPLVRPLSRPPSCRPLVDLPASGAVHRACLYACHPCGSRPLQPCRPGESLPIRRSPEAAAL